MKSIFCIFVLLFCSLSYARKNPEAFYTVPVPAELDAFAEFPIEMSMAYSSKANQISYPLPLKLTGLPRVNVVLHRDATNKNLWQGDNFRSVCVEEGKYIQCQLFLLNKNIFSTENLKKYLDSIAIADTAGLQKMLPEVQSFMMSAIPCTTAAADLQFKLIKNIPSDIIKVGDIKKQISVLNQFLCSEPAGVLTQRLPEYGEED